MIENLFWSVNYDPMLVPIPSEPEEVKENKIPEVVPKEVKLKQHKKKKKKQKYNNSIRARSSRGRR